MIKSLVLAFFCLLGLANSAVYDVAFKFELADPDTECTHEESLALRKVAADAMLACNVLEASNEDDFDTYRPDPVNTSDGGAAAPDVFGGPQRRLYCDPWCQHMCQTQNIWCECCSCCGNRRRVLRVQTERQAQEVEECASSEAKVALDTNSLTSPVTCVASSHNVTVEMDEK